MQNNTIREAYRLASSFLSEKGIDDPLFEVEWMLRELLDVDRASFFLMWDTPFPEEKLQKWEDWVRRRGNQEPLQYIFGSATFYGRSFYVTPDVLIPRPETELLVEHVLRLGDQLFDSQPIHVVEVGTGSGCIAVTLQVERPDWSITTIDISSGALQIAKQNALLHGVEQKLSFCHGSYLEPIKQEGIHLIVSNPPYIPSPFIAQLDPEVQSHEPHLALDGGVDGLHLYRVITEQVAMLQPMPKRLVAFEIGEDQGMQVAGLVREIPRCSWVEVRKDMMDRDRYVFGFFEIR